VGGDHRSKYRVRCHCPGASGHESCFQECQHHLWRRPTHNIIEEVLVEGYSKQSERDVTGRTRTNKTVNFEGDLGLVGRLVQTKITKAYAHSLRGEIVPSDCGMPNADCGMKTLNL